MIGIKLQQHAKRSLLRNFKEGIDFNLTRSGEIVNEFVGFAEDCDPRAEIIMLTLNSKVIIGII
jgi:hypothetical protein